MLTKTSMNTQEPADSSASSDGASTIPADSTEPASSTSPSDVVRAFRLAWHMAEAFDGARDHAPNPERPERIGLELHLPGWSELTPEERDEVLRAQILDDLRVLGVKGTPAVNAVANDPLTERERYRAALDTLFRTLHLELAAKDGKLQMALGLGRALADTANLPETNEQLKAELQHWRLTNIYGWLDDLHQLLPEGAADAVHGSLQNWESYAAELAPEAEMIVVRRHLRAQGKLWKQLLCGDKLVRDQLRPDDYEAAAKQLLFRFRVLVARFAVDHKIAIGITSLVLIALAVLILFSGADFDQKLIGIVVTALGAFGVTWTAIKGTVGRAMAAVEKPLLEAELKDAASQACTIIPVDESGDLKRRRFLSRASSSV